MTGFNPDVIKVLREYDLLGFIVDYLKNESFPSKNRWKTIAKRATHEKDQQEWISRIHQKTGLQLYFASLPVLEVSKWYQVWNYSSMHSRQIIDVVRLICVSLTIKNNRLGNDGTLTRICPACDCSFTNPVHHALLFCKETERAREDWWAWIIDNLPISISVVFNNLDDVNFVKALLGDCTFFEDKTNLLNMDFLLESAEYISY